jgi:hypothetical protein
MNQEFDAGRNVYIDQDVSGIARQLLHFHAPVFISASTPQLVAHSYLHQFADLLGLPLEQLANLGLTPSEAIEKSPVEYRFFKEKRLFDSATVAYYQTDLGLPVWQAGVSVQIKLNPQCVLSSQSTIHPNLEVKTPSAAAVKRVQTITESQLAAQLGLSTTRSRAAESLGLKIEDRRLFVYLYDAKHRLLPVAPPRESKRRITGFQAPLPSLPVPAVDRSIRDGQHYVCLKVDFALRLKPYGMLHWVALLEVETLSVLYLRPFIDSVSGLVFEDDPITTNGGPLPSATSPSLNPVRVSVALPGLSAPSGGNQSLAGNNVQLSDVEVPTVAPPTESSGTDFNFDARTNGFAAVNAYYHTDKFFRLMDGMGFTQSSFFGGTTFPCNIDHRGSNPGDPDGTEINAHCLGNSGGGGIGNTTFMLADLGDTTNPIGIACDYRVVLHELAGHGVLYNHVSSANFKFSHSAGDGVAAILNDPGSQAADRFVTFPWVDIGRRHDRKPADGWGYAGSIALNPFDPTLDNKGYNNEQILSSTHFRLYQSIGGDSADLSMKQFAARMTVYLIMRGIATLTPATTPADANGWVTALQSADSFDWTTENITGGAYGKVIRWAFEKQGLFQAAGASTPNNNEGIPPAVDIYVDDGRGGEYQYQPVYWDNQNIWNRLAADGGTTHQTPVTNQTNYAYVKIKNRGSQTATSVIVNAYHANPAAGLSYPIDWTPMSTTQLSAANVPANNSGEITVGPFSWIPTHVGHECIFMVVTANGDSANTTKIAAGDSIPEWRLVPNDNNIGQRNVYPISGGGTSGLTADFNQLQFTMKNPMATTVGMKVQITLPAFLQKLGWRVEFLNAGGSSFPLRPGESQKISMKIIPGSDFTAADISATDKSIQLWGYAGGILVGGMSYTLDPTVKPPHGGGTGGECEKIATSLLNCLDSCIDTKHEKVRRVRIRKINIDIELDEGCQD